LGTNERNMTLWQKIIGYGRNHDDRQRASKSIDGQRRNYYVYFHKDAAGQIFYGNNGGQTTVSVLSNGSAYGKLWSVPD
jgi:hypothetical protein